MGPMTARALFPAVLLLLGAAGPVAEVEPDRFDAPQSVGTLGPAGIQVTGSINPTSANGLAPGDDDGFSFTMGAGGSLTATVDGGAGTTFVLGLATVGAPGGSLLGVVMGPAPLTLAIPGLLAGTDYRVGVTALGSGTAVPYALSLSAADSLPAWSGAESAGPVDEAEPDDTVAGATDLGDYTGPLHGRGTLSSVIPPDPENPVVGDVDVFRFRNILPVSARLVFQADPGLLVVEVDQLIFLGPLPVAISSFGEAGEVALPPLHPGAEYLVQIHADQGTAPLAYSFFLEPASPVPPADAEPLAILGASVRLPKGAGRGSFDLLGSFEPGLASQVPDGAVFSYAVRGVGDVFAAGLLEVDDRGRLRYKAPPGTAGLRFLVVDPYGGTFRLRGRGVDWGDAGDPADPTISLELALGDVLLTGTAEGTGKGRVLRVK